ncbi:MAG: 50S ribosomal protein L23 [Planctomycetota bacterium]|nr:MAG: 50S ribosomal protein L23 [Planctomycetota bacterium]
MKDLNKNSILVRPIFTEKSDKQEVENNISVFEVVRTATKQQIKDAVKEIFNVRVEKVNVINVKGKRKRMRGNEGFTSTWKKALVKIHVEDRLDYPSI